MATTISGSSLAAFLHGYAPEETSLQTWIADAEVEARRSAIRDVRALIVEDGFEYESDYDADDSPVDSISNYRDSLLAAIDRMVPE